jgi:hypothetical protein
MIYMSKLSVPRPGHLGSKTLSVLEEFDRGAFEAPQIHRAAQLDKRHMHRSEWYAIIEDCQLTWKQWRLNGDVWADIGI